MKKYIDIHQIVAQVIGFVIGYCGGMWVLTNLIP